MSLLEIAHKLSQKAKACEHNWVEERRGGHKIVRCTECSIMKYENPRGGFGILPRRGLP